jgi:hypothetical protein
LATNTNSNRSDSTVLGTSLDKFIIEHEKHEKRWAIYQKARWAVVPVESVIDSKTEGNTIDRR